MFPCEAELVYISLYSSFSFVLYPFLFLDIPQPSARLTIPSMLFSVRGGVLMFGASIPRWHHLFPYTYDTITSATLTHSPII